MPYIEQDGRKVFVHTRDPMSYLDPPQRAAEQFARDAESFLYDERSGVWMKPEFLAAALARYDATKHGSGGVTIDFDPEVLGQDLSADRNPGVVKDSRVLYSEDARIADHIDTGETLDVPERKRVPTTVHSPLDPKPQVAAKDDSSLSGPDFIARQDDKAALDAGLDPDEVHAASNAQGYSDVRVPVKPKPKARKPRNQGSPQVDEAGEFPGGES